MVPKVVGSNPINHPSFKDKKPLVQTKRLFYVLSPTSVVYYLNTDDTDFKGIFCRKNT